ITEPIMSAELIEKLQKLADYIKAHPEEAREGVAKLSAEAQKPAGDIIKIFCSDKDPKTKHEEITALKAALPAAIAAEIEEHKEQLKKKL
ncbi:hypothetical protein PFISCL1PPCAC_1658, partial [Pristionchus fissidentatus]